jgi:hypothetical protein
MNLTSDQYCSILRRLDKLELGSPSEDEWT